MLTGSLFSKIFKFTEAICLQSCGCHYVFMLPHWQHHSYSHLCSGICSANIIPGPILCSVQEIQRWAYRVLPSKDIIDYLGDIGTFRVLRTHREVVEGSQKWFPKSNGQSGQ